MLVNVDNYIQIERAIFMIIIDPKEFTGVEPINLELIGETYFLSYWWFAFLITFFHVGIS